jgi:glutathione S-transferase
MTRTLYLTSRSPFARKVQILLAEKNLDCSFIAVDLQNKSPAR